MSSSERITAAELERSKRARTIARNWLEAEETRLKLAGLDPAVEGDGAPGVQMRPSKFGRPSPLERVREAHVSGLEIREFQKGLEGSAKSDSNNSKSPIGPSDIAGAKARIVEALAKAGKSAAEIEDYLARVSPHLDVYAIAANDPTSQALLYSRVMSGNGQAGLKDFVEAVRLANELRPQQQQGGMGELANALATAMKSGVEAARGNSSTDQTIAQLYQQMSTQQQASFDRHLELVRERMDEAPSFADQLHQIVEVQSTLGKLGAGTREPPEILAKRLELADKQAEREHNARTEAAKDERSGKMWSGIAGTLSKALETPIVREFGRKAAENLPSIGKVTGGVSNVQHAAARSVLDQSSDISYGFRCPTCGTEHRFNQQQLATIESSVNHTWACPTCGSTYVLSGMPGQQGAGQQSRPQQPPPQPPEQYQGPGF